MNTTFYNSNNNSDFKSFTQQKYGTGTITLDEVNKVFTLSNDVATAYLQLSLPNLKIGDKISLTADVDGTGDFAMAINHNDGATEGTRFMKPIDSSVKKIKAVFVVKKNSNYKIGFGAFYQRVLSCTVKNIVISVQSDSHVKSLDNVCVATIQSTDTGVFSVRSDLSTIGATVTNYDVNTLRLSFSVTFPRRLIPFVDRNYDGEGYNYTARAINQPGNIILIKIYDTANVVVPIANIPKYVYVSILLA